MHLQEDNRWVKKAQSIPWDKIEAKHADRFPSETGNVAKPLQLALGACLIQREFGYSNMETVLQMQENPYLQYFCRHVGYDDSKPPLDPSSMVYFRKRLTPDILAQINEMITQKAQKEAIKMTRMIIRQIAEGTATLDREALTSFLSRKT